MMNVRHMMAAGSDSPAWDRGLLTIGRTAADDLAEFGAGDSHAAVQEESDEGTLSGDVKDFDFEQGYHDDLPPELEAEDGPDDTHDYRKRHSDTRAALDRERAEKAALQAQLATLQQQRMQPNQPNVLQPGQVDPQLSQIDQAYAAEKERLKRDTMNTIRGFKREDPAIQDKIADAWARHSEQVAELVSTVQERRAQVQADKDLEIRTYREQQTDRALTQAGYDAKADREAFIERVVLLNHRQPGWDRGMDQAATYDYVVQQMRQGGHVSAQPETLTPRQQHEALRNTGKTSVRPGVRQDPSGAKKKALPEEKDVSFHDQMRQAKRRRLVTEEQATRMKIR